MAMAQHMRGHSPPRGVPPHEMHPVPVPMNHVAVGQNQAGPPPPHNVNVNQMQRGGPPPPQSQQMNGYMTQGPPPPVQQQMVVHQGPPPPQHQAPHPSQQMVLAGPAQQQMVQLAPENASQSAKQYLATLNENIWMRIASLAEAMSIPDEAIFAYDRILTQHNPNSQQAKIGIAGVYRQNEQFDLAQKVLEDILNVDPTHGESWGALGHCFLMQEQLQNAYTAYQRAIIHLRNPQEPKLWYGIGILYDRYGSLDHAEEAFSRVMVMAPDFDKANEIYFRLGIIYKQQQKYAQSLECFRYIVHNPPHPLTEEDIWFQIGHVHESQKDYESAKAAYSRVLEKNPTHAKVLQQLGWLYHQASPSFPSQEKAIEFLEKSVQSDTNDAQSWYLLGRCYMSQSKHGKAYEAYQQAVYRDGRNPTFWCSIGVLYYQINQFRDALDAYSKAIRLNPNISEVWYDLGTLYESCNNQTNDALDAYQRAADLDPTNQNTKIRLQLLREQQAGIAPAGAIPAPQGPSVYQPPPPGMVAPAAPQWGSIPQGQPQNGPGPAPPGMNAPPPPDYGNRLAAMDRPQALNAPPPFEHQQRDGRSTVPPPQGRLSPRSEAMRYDPRGPPPQGPPPPQSLGRRTPPPMQQNGPYISAPQQRPVDPPRQMSSYGPPQPQPQSQHLGPPMSVPDGRRSPAGAVAGQERSPMPMQAAPPQQQPYLAQGQAQNAPDHPYAAPHHYQQGQQGMPPPPPHVYANQGPQPAHTPGQAMYGGPPPVSHSHPQGPYEAQAQQAQSQQQGYRDYPPQPQPQQAPYGRERERDVKEPFRDEREREYRPASGFKRPDRGEDDDVRSFKKHIGSTNGDGRPRVEDARDVREGSRADARRVDERVRMDERVRLEDPRYRDSPARTHRRGSSDLKRERDDFGYQSQAQNQNRQPKREREESLPRHAQQQGGFSQNFGGPPPQGAGYPPNQGQSQGQGQGFGQPSQGPAQTPSHAQAQSQGQPQYSQAQLSQNEAAAMSRLGYHPSEAMHTSHPAPPPPPHRPESSARGPSYGYPPPPQHSQVPPQGHAQTQVQHAQSQGQSQAHGQSQAQSQVHSQAKINSMPPTPILAGRERERHGTAPHTPTSAKKPSTPAPTSANTSTPLGPPPPTSVTSAPPVTNKGDEKEKSTANVRPPSAAGPAPASVPPPAPPAQEKEQPEEKRNEVYEPAARKMDLDEDYDDEEPATAPAPAPAKAVEGVEGQKEQEKEKVNEDVVMADAGAAPAKE